MIELDLKELSQREIYFLLTGAILPRPIALVATTSTKGIHNLAPFSSFNLVSSNPACVSFSVSRQDDGKKKDTLINLESNPEMTINCCHEDMLDQVALSGANFPANISEFSETKLSPLVSLLVDPPRVAESFIQMEARVYKLIEIGSGEVGSSTLVIAELLKIHIASAVWENKRINPEKLKPLARLGASYYAGIDNIRSQPTPRLRN